MTLSNRPEKGNSAAQLDPSTWLDEHGDVLFGYALRRVDRSDVAEDLVQDTLVAALRAQDTFSNRSAVRTWLVSILRNKIADHFRQASHRPATNGLAIDDLPETQDFVARGHWQRTLGSWPTDPAQAFENKEFWQVFDRCLSKLPPLLLQAYVVREYDQMSTDEACKELGISASNLSVRLFRARLLLRRCLEKNWFQGEGEREI